MSVVMEGFQVMRMYRDYQKWAEAQHVATTLSSFQSPDDLISYITHQEEQPAPIPPALIRDMNHWMDVTIDEMIATFRRHGLNTHLWLRFLRQHHSQYFTPSHLVRCPERHVVGFFPVAEGVDAEEVYCMYCKENFTAPPKMHQVVVYNWIEQH